MDSLTKNTMDLVGLSEIEKRDHLQSCIAGCSGFKFLWLHSLHREVPRMPDPHSFICLQTRFHEVAKRIRRKEQFSPHNFCFGGEESTKFWERSATFSTASRLVPLLATLSSSP